MVHPLWVKTKPEIRNQNAESMTKFEFPMTFGAVLPSSLAPSGLIRHSDFAFRISPSSLFPYLSD